MSDDKVEERDDALDRSPTVKQQGKDTPLNEPLCDDEKPYNLIA